MGFLLLLMTVLYLPLKRACGVFSQGKAPLKAEDSAAFVCSIRGL